MKMFLHGAQRRWQKKSATVTNISSQLTVHVLLKTSTGSLWNGSKSRECIFNMKLYCFFWHLYPKNCLTEFHQKSFHDSMTSTRHLAWMCGWVGVKPGSCGALCTWSTLKTSHNIELTDTASHEQDWDPLTNHRTVNRRSTEPWERAHGGQRGGSVSTVKKKKASQQTEDKLKGSPQKKKEKTTAMQNHDRDRQVEVEEAAELWRLQETSARQRNKREEGESQTVITRQHEVLSNTLQGGNSERAERSQKGKKKRNWGYTNRTDDSPQPTNTARVQLPHTHRQPKKTSRHCLDQLTITFIRI